MYYLCNKQSIGYNLCLKKEVKMMKKRMSIVLSGLLVFSVFSISALAALEKNGKYEILKAVATPNIDGVKEADGMILVCIFC